MIILSLTVTYLSEFASLNLSEVSSFEKEQKQVIMILFSSGWYHSHDSRSVKNNSYLDDCSPFYVVLLLLVLDKFSQNWQSNERFGCTKEVMEVYATIENAESKTKA